MRMQGIELDERENAFQNLLVPTGTEFPAETTAGELFYHKGTADPFVAKGLYIWDSVWTRLGAVTDSSGGSIDIEYNGQTYTADTITIGDRLELVPNGQNNYQVKLKRDVVQLGTTATVDVNTQSVVFVPWDVQDEISTEYFTHSTTTDNSRLYFKKPGQYRFYMSLTCQITGGTTRWRVILQGLFKNGTEDDKSRSRVVMRRGSSDINHSDKTTVLEITQADVDNSSYIEVGLSRVGGGSPVQILGSETSFRAEYLRGL